MSQKSISSSPTDQTSDGSREEPPKAPRRDEAEGKITSMNRWNRAEKRHSDASPSQLCCWLTFQSFLWDLTHVPSSVPVSCQAGGWEGAWSIPCPPAVPWRKVRKCCMPWLPLRHLSSSHWSALCQFRSSAVGQMASGTACQIPRELSSSHPERGCWRETSKSPRSGGLGQAVGCTRGACKDNWLMSGTACPAVVPLFLANVHLFLPEFGARPLLPPALSFNPTGEAAAIYSGKALVNCLFF